MPRSKKADAPAPEPEADPGPYRPGRHVPVMLLPAGGDGKADVDQNDPKATGPFPEVALGRGLTAQLVLMRGEVGEPMWTVVVRGVDPDSYHANDKAVADSLPAPMNSGVVADEPASDMMTTAQVARWLHVRPHTVLWYTRADGLPHIRIATRSLLFSRKAVQAWLDDRHQVIVPQEQEPRKRSRNFQPPVPFAGWDGKSRIKKMPMWG